MQTLNLSDYKIHVGDVWTAINKFLNENAFSKVAVIIDENTKKHCLPLLKANVTSYDFSLIEIPSGEINKTISTCELIWQRMMEYGLDRHSLTINLGGGVIGDMGGFCAATFKRGMAFIQIPSTLLAQVDASIGGKLGIDFNEVKNAVGLFQNPQAVFVDPVFLKTLSYKELRSGFAEIIKHGLIADANLWKDLATVEDIYSLNMEDLIYRSLLVKQNVVEQDPFEKGIRKVLNFGHTIGHALESVALNSSKPLLHGEAIAIGMVCEAWLSQKENNLTSVDLHTISKYIFGLYGKRTLLETDFPEYLSIMVQDKKNQGKTINFTYLRSIGSSTFDCTSSEEAILDSLRYYNSLTL